MSDCEDRGFSPVLEAEKLLRNNLGIQGAWFVLNSRDYFSDFENETHKGIHVSNCCGSFDLAIKK